MDNLRSYHLFRVRSLLLDFFPLDNFSTGYFFFPVEKLSSGSTFLPLKNWKNAFSDRLGQHQFIIYLITGTVSGYPNVNTLFLTHNLRISKFSIPWYFKASLLCLYLFSDFKSLDQLRNLSFLTKYIWSKFMLSWFQLKKSN